tara:strand:- start:88 stop:459 length:372 start_codon:yes stop_codon:yes gene_type:complete
MEGGEPPTGEAEGGGVQSSGTDEGVACLWGDGLGERDDDKIDKSCEAQREDGMPVEEIRGRGRGFKGDYGGVAGAAEREKEPGAVLKDKEQRPHNTQSHQHDEHVDYIILSGDWVVEKVGGVL